MPDSGESETMAQICMLNTMEESMQQIVSCGSAKEKLATMSKQKE